MSLIPNLLELQIQERPNGEWLVGSGRRHVIAGREMLSIIRSLAGTDHYEHAYTRYRESGGRLAYESFYAQAARCKSIFDTSGTNQDKTVKLRVELLQSTTVLKVTPLLHFLFNQPGRGFGIIAAMIAIGFVVASFHWSDVVACSISSLTAPQILAGFSVALFGALFHELGHATALSRFRQPPGTIGFGFYAGILPVFYADLSYSWRLCIRDRIVVSLGGVYFQLIFSTLIIGISTIWKIDFLLAAGLSSAVLALFQLMPVARSDGFWILADLLGERLLGKYEHTLWLDWRKRSVAGKSARRRLMYQTLNLLFVASLLVLAFARARLFGFDLLIYIRTGMTAESLDSPDMFLSFLIFCLLLTRVSVSLFKLLVNAILKRGRMQILGRD